MCATCCLLRWTSCAYFVAEVLRFLCLFRFDNLFLYWVLFIWFYCVCGLRLFWILDLMWLAFGWIKIVYFVGVLYLAHCFFCLFYVFLSVVFDFGLDFAGLLGLLALGLLFAFTFKGLIVRLIFGCVLELCFNFLIIGFWCFEVLIFCWFNVWLHFDCC